MFYMHDNVYLFPVNIFLWITNIFLVSDVDCREKEKTKQVLSLSFFNAWRQILDWASCILQHFFLFKYINFKGNLCVSVFMSTYLRSLQ